MKNLVSFIFPFILDRVTKLTALMYLDEPIAVTSWLTLRLVKNRGISWSLFYSVADTPFILMTIVLCVIIIALSVITIKNWQQSKPIFGNLLVISGAVSNVVDRLMYGGVIDFIELSYKGYSWPILNIADCAIVFGTFSMLYYYWKNE